MAWMSGRSASSSPLQVNDDDLRFACARGTGFEDDLLLRVCATRGFDTQDVLPRQTHKAAAGFGGGKGLDGAKRPLEREVRIAANCTLCVDDVHDRHGC